MPNKTWAVGDELLATDINSYIQKQSVQVFSNAALRNTAIPVPTVGMIVFLADTGAIEVFTDKTTPSSWRPPWNTAWGLIYNNVFGGMTLGVGYAWIIRYLPCPLAGRYYKVEVEANFAQSGASAGTEVMRFQDIGSQGLVAWQTISAAWNERICLCDVFTGNPGLDLGVIGNCDNNTCGLQWGRVRVFDVGPV
jgi:hypothetical protein